MTSDVIRDRDESKLYRKGTFKCAYNCELVILLIGSVFMLLLVTFSISVIVKSSMDTELTLDIGETTTLIVELFLLYLWAFLCMGRECSYSAHETEFVVEGPGKRREVFYYCDVVDITYERWNRPGPASNGYIVKITTGVRTVTYRYIFGDRRIDETFEGTPFYVLAVNSGLMDYHERSYEEML